MNEYRVKCFLFVKANNPTEAEETAASLIDASQRKDGSGVLVQAVVRQNSAKIIELKKRKEAA